MDETVRLCDFVTEIEERGGRDQMSGYRGQDLEKSNECKKGEKGIRRWVDKLGKEKIKNKDKR